MNHYPRHIGDYLRDTGHLTLLEHGVYSRLLDLYYLNNGPISKDIQGLCRKLGARTADERGAVEAIVSEFFVLSDVGMLTNKRCESVIAKYQELSEQQRQRVRKRYAKPTANLPPVDQTLPAVGEKLPPVYQEPYTGSGIPTINHKPITNNHKPKENPPTPRKRGKPATAGDSAPVDWFEGLLPELDIPAFRDRWLEWVEYRRKLEEPVNSATLPAVFRVIARMGIETFMAQSENAMAHGWVGFQHKIKDHKDDHRSEKRSREFPESAQVPDLL